jgi:hypothetical protein
LRKISGVSAVWLLMTFVACSGDPDAALRAELRDLQAMIARVGARIVSETPVTRFPGGVKATWDVEVTTTWDEYLQHVRDRLIGFSSNPSASATAVFVRMLPSDTYTVHIERLGGSSPFRVRVSFSSLVR